MCIVTFHHQEHPKYKLIVASNRDEFYERPTSQANFWKDYPSILAGRDLKECGTWLGITKEGRIAMLTNYRDLASERDDRKSRGQLVNQFLMENEEPYHLFEQLQSNKAQYNGFNLIAGTVDELYHYGNNESKITPITAGAHSVSNGPLLAKWPKTKKAKEMMQEYVQSCDEIYIDDLFEQLNNRELALDEHLPSTGIDFPLERNLSSIFIDKVENYGTRTSTVILVTHDNDVTFVERTFNQGTYSDERQFTFSI